MIFSKRALANALFAYLIGLCTVHAVAQTTFKIATVSPDGSAWMRDLRRSIDLLEAQTEGRVKFRVYPGGVMGDDRTVLRKIRARQLHGGILQTGALDAVSSSVQLYNLPMYFRDFDEVTAVREKIDHVLIEELAEKGFEAFGFVGLGFANAMSSKPGTSIADAQRLKVWTPKGDAGVVRLFKAFDIVPIPLSIVDVFAGLQTGLIDTVASPPTAAIILQWHTQLEYILDLPFMYIYSVFVVDGKQFERLEPSDRVLTRKLFKNLLARVEQQNYIDHAKALDALVKQGITVLTPSATEREAWRQAAAGAIVTWADSGVIQSKHAELLEKTVTEYRASLAK